MAEYQEVIKQFKRMCNYYNGCTNCPLVNKRDFFHCWRWISEKPEEAEKIIMDWAKKNPVFTNHDKFKKVFGLDFKTTFKASPWTLEWLDEEYKEPKDE